LIDYFALALTHALIVIALLRVLVRPDLDREDLSVDMPVRDAKPAHAKGRRALRDRKGGGDA
jgi:hypothetical protein